MNLQHPQDTNDSPSTVKNLSWYQSLNIKIPVAFLVLFLLMFISVFGIIKYFGTPLIDNIVQNVIEQKGNQVVAELQQSITLAEGLAHSLAKTAGIIERDSVLFKQIIPEIMNVNEQKSLIAGGGIWPEPYKFDHKVERRSFFFGRQPNGILRYYTDYNNPEGPGYTNEEWYVPAAVLKTESFFWSKSYMDIYSFEPMITVTVPIYRSGEFFGVSTVDIKLDRIQTFMNHVSEITGGYAFALDRNNKFITYPSRDLVKVYNYDESGQRIEEFIYADKYAEKDTLFIPILNELNNITKEIREKAESLPNYNHDLIQRIEQGSYQINSEEASNIYSAFLDPLYSDLTKTMLYSRFESLNDPLVRQPVKISIFVMPKTYWKIVFVTPVKITEQTSSSIAGRLFMSMTLFLLVTSVIGFLLSKKYILGPIISMTRKIQDTGSQFSSGLDLDVPLKNEIGILAASFNDLTNHLVAVLESERKSQKLLQAILDNSPAIVTLKDTNCRYTMVNNRFNKLLNVDDNEIIGKTDSELFAEINAGQLGDDDLIVLKDGKEIQSEITYRQDNEIQTYISLKFPIIGKNNEINAVCCILTDITSRKSIEESLISSEARFREVFEKSSDAFCVVKDERIVMINPKFEEMFGYGSEEVLSQNFRLTKLISKDSLQSFKNRFEKMDITEIEKTPMNIMGKTKSSESIELDVSISIIKWDESDATLLIIRDVREQRKLMAQIQQMQKMESIGMLAGGVAHDFNNLLTAIDGYSEIIKLKLEDNNSVDNELNEIFASTSRAADLTKQLLAFSRRQILTPKVLNLNRIINEMDKMLRRLIGENIEFITKTAPNLWNIKADPTQIEQIVLNLVVNARDAMPKGGELIVETSNVDINTALIKRYSEFDLKPGEHVCITVRDSGHGMSENIMKQIFEPFFTTKDAGKGTGLGLATVFGIVMQSSGQIAVKSELENGSEFSVYFPRVKASEDINKKAVKEDLNLNGDEVILLVEDEYAVREMVASTLQRYGYKVLITKNGDEALGLCKKRKIPFDLLLSDVVMPVMGGPELVQHVRDIWPDVKVILMSGYLENAILENHEISSETPMLEKPFKPIKLVKLIREVLAE